MSFHGSSPSTMSGTNHNLSKNNPSKVPPHHPIPDSSALQPHDSTLQHESFSSGVPQESHPNYSPSVLDLDPLGHSNLDSLDNASSVPDHNNNNASDLDFLDLLSADMDFEKAYSMYTTLQQKNAISSIEQLEKVQLLNQQFVSNLGSRGVQERTASVNSNSQTRVPEFPESFDYLATGNAPEEFNFHRSQILFGGSLPNKNYMFMPEDGHSNSTSPSVKSNNAFPKQTKEDDEEFDQFFSNTESNALEKFLDNLANPSDGSFQFYNNNNNHNSNSNHGFEGSPGQDFNDLFDLHTMKAIPMSGSSSMTSGYPQRFRNFQQQQHIPKSNSLPVNMTQQSVLEHETLKKELTEAFSHPHLKSISNSPPHTSTSPSQLLTPKESKENNFNYQNLKKESQDLITPPSSDNNEAISKQESRKREYDGFTGESQDKANTQKKRRRSSSKPLLSLEQKRLNHSHSEQKRRQMCKLAYERCLRLIIDIEAFNKLPATVTDSAQRKSKRARVNKDGLPNLSKHSALIRISHEIELIKDKNDVLKALLEQNGITDHHKFEPPVSREID